MDTAAPATGSEAGAKDAPYSYFPKAELMVVSLYITLASLWIVFSDEALDWLTGSPEESLALQTYKGLNFVATTSLLLFLVLHRSFTRRRRAEEMSRESTERFELAARSATDAIFDWNLVTNSIWWGAGRQNLFGYPKEERQAQANVWGDRIHPDDRDRVREGIRRVLEGGGEAWRDDFRWMRKDGTYAEVFCRGYVIRDAGNKPARLVGGMSDMTERKRAEEAVRRSRQQLRAFSARLESLREEERTRISREIHDELGQMLTGLKMDLRWIEKKLSQAGADPALNPVLDKVVEASELTDTTIAAVQKIAAELRPGVLDDLGITPAIKHESGRFQKRTGIVCQHHLPEHPIDLPPSATIVVFRILQEALTNVARHAGASEVQIKLREDGDHWILEVHDNGKGLSEADLANPRALGLLGMKERARAVGGEVTFQSGATRGASVLLRVPRKVPEGTIWELL